MRGTDEHEVNGFEGLYYVRPIGDGKSEWAQVEWISPIQTRTVYRCDESEPVSTNQILISLEHVPSIGDDGKGPVSTNNTDYFPSEHVLPISDGERESVSTNQTN